MFLFFVAIIASSEIVVEDDDNQEFITQEEIDYINSVQSNWVASKKWVGSMTKGEAKKYLGSSNIKKSNFPEYDWGKLLDHFTPPTSFDSRQQWPQCQIPIGNQTTCQAGYAFATTASLSERFCIQDKSGRFQGVNLSPQYLVNCVQTAGCDDVDSNDVWSVFQTQGVGLASCIPFTGNVGTCPRVCSNGTPVTPFKISGTFSYSTQTSIQAAILSDGPVVGEMSVYKDFLTYTSGIYTHTTGSLLYTTKVKILGWGNSGGPNYWICANSLGTNWGLGGYFNIAFDQVGIDDLVTAATPLF